MGDLTYATEYNGRGPTLAQQFALLTELGYELTDAQRAPFECRARQKLVAGGERGGKSFVTAAELTTRAPWGKLFWIIGSDYEAARPEFIYTAEWLERLGAFNSPRRDISIPRFGKCRMQLKSGQVVETRTADDVRKIASWAPDGIVLAEAAQLPYEIYLKAIGRLSEHRGWLLMSGTFEGSTGWYPELFDEWQTANADGGISFSVPTWSNSHVFPLGRDDPEIRRLEAVYSKVPGLFEERCGAIPMPPANLVFRAFRETVHVDSSVRFDPTRRVWLAVDPSGGTAPYAVAAVQFYRPDEIGFVSNEPPVDAIDFMRIIDIIYERGKTDEEIIEMAKARPWWSRVRGGSCDIEAPDSVKRWRKLGGITLASKKIPVIEGIRRMQTFLYNRKDKDTQKYTWPPHLLIAPGLRELSYEFRNYKRAKPIGSSKQGLEFDYKDEPPPSQMDHLLKALWYLLIQRYGYVKSPSQAKVTYTWTNPSRRTRSSRDSNQESPQTLPTAPIS